METPNSLEKISGWENMERNILAKIFGMLNVIDIIMGTSQVCVSWFLASHNRTLWKSIDLSNLKSIILDNNPKKANFPANDDEKGRYELRTILTEIAKFSSTITTDLVFDFYYFIQEEDRTIIAPRMPNVKKILLPLWNNLNENSLQFTFSQWKNLQTLIITQPSLPLLTVNFRAIGENCKNLTNLKLIRPLNQDLAEQIVNNFSNLKRLSFRCASVCENALLSLITDHQNLRILNLSHCIFMEIDGDEVFSVVNMFPNKHLVQTATQKLDKFIACLNYCKTCKELWKLLWRDRKFDYLYYMFHNEQMKIDEIKELEF